MRFNTARIVLPSLLAVFLHPQAALPQCVLPQAAQSRTGFLATPAARYSDALTYADHRCLSEAKALLKEAAAGLATESGSKVATLRNLVTSATEYVAALESIARGDTDGGFKLLRQIIERGTNVVSLRAVITLATAIVRNATPAQWHTVEEPLEELARRGHVRAELLIIERIAQRGGLPAAIAAVEERLAEAPDLQRGLSLEVFLIELYARASRFIDAQLLLVVLEDDAATTLLDLEMRKRLLEAGLVVSTALISQGRSEFTTQREAYARALAELRRFTS